MTNAIATYSSIWGVGQVLKLEPEDLHPCLLICEMELRLLKLSSSGSHREEKAGVGVSQWVTPGKKHTVQYGMNWSTSAD